MTYLSEMVRTHSTDFMTALAGFGASETTPEVALFPTYNIRCDMGMTPKQVFTELVSRNHTFDDIITTEEMLIDSDGYTSSFNTTYHTCPLEYKCLHFQYDQTVRSLRVEYENAIAYAGPNSVEMLALLRHDECVAMKLYDGPMINFDLDHMYSHQELAQMLLDLLIVIERIHEDGNMYYDLKPQNVMYSVDADALILKNFGFVQEERSGVHFTPAYSGFEVAKDRSHDIYGFGEIIRSAFGVGHARIQRRYCIWKTKALRECQYRNNFEYVRPTLFKPKKEKVDLPEPFKRIAAACMAYHPSKRAWIPEIKQMLESIIHGEEFPPPYKQRRLPKCKSLKNELLLREPEFKDLNFVLYQGSIEGFPGEVFSGYIILYGCPIYIYATEVAAAEVENDVALRRPIARTSLKFFANKQLDFMNQLTVRMNSKFERYYTLMLYQVV